MVSSFFHITSLNLRTNVQYNLFDVSAFAAAVQNMHVCTVPLVIGHVFRFLRCLSSPPSLIIADWSNSKAVWAKSKPMNDEELLFKQVQMTTAATKNATVWVYRCSVYAYPWYTSVRAYMFSSYTYSRRGRNFANNSPNSLIFGWKRR